MDASCLTQVGRHGTDTAQCHPRYNPCPSVQHQLTNMNDYELLGLMDTHKAMKNQGVDVPDSFPEFLAGVTPIEEEQPVVDTE